MASQFEGDPRVEFIEDSAGIEEFWQDIGRSGLAEEVFLSSTMESGEKAMMEPLGRHKEELEQGGEANG